MRGAARFAGLVLALGAQAAYCQSTPAEHAIQLAERGRCQEALPLLKRAVVPQADKEGRRRMGIAGVRCAMTLNQPLDAAEFLDKLNRAFPKDAAVLYLATHVYSDLSMRASQELIYSNPGSPEVHELNAESLEMRGDWQHAIEEYQTVLARNPHQPGIHYRIARLILSQPKTDKTFPDAKAELDAELQVDPQNAGAEYVLGEIARQEEQWPPAIDHFSKASKLDAGFADAFTGLGRSLLSAEKAPEAVAPLERAVQLDPANPTVHYYAAIALRRAGRKAESERESALFQQTSAQSQQTKDDVHLGIMGPQRLEPSKP